MGSSRAKPLRLIPHIHRTTHRLGLRIAASLGVAQAEAHILQHLAAAGDSTVGQLHEAFAHRRSTLTSVLDRLEAAGLILRTASRTDRRTFVISLTEAGRAASARVHTGLQDIEKKALLGVAERDLKGFTNVLQALEGALRRPSEAGPERPRPKPAARASLLRESDDEASPQRQGAARGLLAFTPRDDESLPRGSALDQ